MSPATLAVLPDGPLGGPLGLVVSSWRSLRARHFGYAALAGLFFGAMQGIGEVLASPTVINWNSVLGTFALSVLLAELLLLALAIAARVRTRHVPKWFPFVLAAACVTLIGAGLASVQFLAFNAEILPRRRLLIGIAGYVVVTAIPLTLAALGYMRGLDAWQRAAALRSLQLERTRMSRKAFESRLQALQARVDPRFLFETLASIEATYEADAARGERMIDDLIAYLRAALPTLEDAPLSLRAEIALVRSWLDLMSVRHGERLTFSIAVADSELRARMPPMVLQPLVQHAVESILEGAFAHPRVAIAVTGGDGRLRVEMTATGPAFSDTAETPATRAIRERLDVLYGADASLTFHWTSRDESRADLEIPHEHADRDHC